MESLAQPPLVRSQAGLPALQLMALIKARGGLSCGSLEGDEHARCWVSRS